MLEMGEQICSQWGSACSTDPRHGIYIATFRCFRYIDVACSKAVLISNQQALEQRKVYSHAPTPGLWTDRLNEQCSTQGVHHQRRLIKLSVPNVMLPVPVECMETMERHVV